MTSTNQQIPVSYPRPMGGHPNGVQLGGIGTGRIELGSNGRISLAGITNNWQRLLAGLEGTFFSLRTQSDATTSFNLLQSEGLDGFSGCAVDYAGSHPFARVSYRLKDCPLKVDLEAFAPLVPHDTETSNTPGVVFRFSLQNESARPTDYQLGFSLENFLGCGSAGRRGLELNCNRTGNKIEPWRQAKQVGLRFSGGAFGPPNARGEMLLATTETRATEVSALESWNLLLDRPAVLKTLSLSERPSRFDGGDIDSLIRVEALKRENPPSWDDPDPRFGGARVGLEGAVHPAGSLILSGQLAPGASSSHPFFLAWFTPHHFCLDQADQDHGHAYAERFADVTSVVQHLATNEERLRKGSAALEKFLSASSLPTWLVEKVLNDQTAVSTNSILTAKGEPYILEASPMMFGALGTLDQRLVSHPGTSLFYPELNRRELRGFARLQAEDGSLPHFNGNAHTALGSAEVEYGETRWPDLACSFIIQVYQDWVDTGDSGFIEEMLPHIERAAGFLVAADRDGDGVPEGGSSWDIEHYSGCFIATATVWMACLRILMKIEERFPMEVDGFEKCFDQAARTVDAMWTGDYYLKYRDPVSGQQSEDVFLGQLAGEWVVRQLGLPSILPHEHVERALKTIYRLNGDLEKYRLMPIQVQPDGSLADRKYAWHAWPQYSLVYVDCLALHTGLREPALRNIEAFDRVVCEINCSPWATTLWHDARSGEPDFGSFMGLDWYMNTPASWWILSALSGCLLNLAEGSLEYCPENLKPGDRFPIITPRCWAILERSSTGFSFQVERVFGADSLQIDCLRERGQADGQKSVKITTFQKGKRLRAGDVLEWSERRS